jgi:hypothetical protein
MSYKCVAVAPNAPGVADSTGFCVFSLKHKVSINVPTRSFSQFFFGRASVKFSPASEKQLL